MKKIYTKASLFLLSFTISTTGLVTSQTASADTTPNVATSNYNHIQSINSINNDSYLSQLGININELNQNNLLKVASLFHIFAQEATLNADTNGNIAVAKLFANNDFGTRESSYNLTTGDIDYIQTLVNNLAPNAFRNATFNHVIMGQNNSVKIKNRTVLVNNVPITHLSPADIFTDDENQPYIDFNTTFKVLEQQSASLSAQKESQGVRTNYADMNQRTIDVKDALPSNGVIYVNVPVEYLNAPQPITITGLATDPSAPIVVANVVGNNAATDQVINTQVILKTTNGNIIPNSESHSSPNHLLWNFGNNINSLSFNSGRFMGSILSPTAHVITNVNIDGNIVSKSVNINGGETHRWDLSNTPVTNPSNDNKGANSSNINKPTNNQSADNKTNDSHSTDNNTNKPDNKPNDNHSADINVNKHDNTQTNNQTADNNTNKSDNKPNNDHSADINTNKPDNKPNNNHSADINTNKPDNKPNNNHSADINTNKPDNKPNNNQTTDNNTDKPDNKPNNNHSADINTNKPDNKPNNNHSADINTNKSDSKLGNKLPQTGEAENHIIPVIGLILIFISVIIGLHNYKKQK